MPRKKQNHISLPSGRVPESVKRFEKFSAAMRALTDFYGFERVHTPLIAAWKDYMPLMRAGMFEWHTPLFAKTSSGAEVTVRPSGILAALSFSASGRMREAAHPLKISFGGERVVVGRGAGGGIEVKNEEGILMVGEEGAIAEAEIIQIIWKMITGVGIANDAALIRVNAVGCSRCRVQFRISFVAYFRNRTGRLCKNCKRNLRRAPTRILLCEEEKCRALAANAPQILDSLCDECKKHLRSLLEFLDEARIPYSLDSTLFKEGTWWSEIIFECCVVMRAAEEKKSGAPASGEINDRAKAAEREKETTLVIAEGGRLTRVSELLTGRKIAATGGSIFFDALECVVVPRPLSARGAPKIFLAQLGELAKRKSLQIMEKLRVSGIDLRESLGRDSIKAQLKIAERIGAEIALILGHKEALDETIIVREIKSGIQEVVPQEKLVDFLKQKLKK